MRLDLTPTVRQYSFDQKLWVLVARHMAIAAAATVSLQL